MWVRFFEFEVGGFGVGGCRLGALKNAAYAPEADLDAWNLQVSWLSMSAAKSDNMSSYFLHLGKQLGTTQNNTRGFAGPEHAPTELLNGILHFGFEWNPVSVHAKRVCICRRAIIIITKMEAI